MSNNDTSALKFQIQFKELKISEFEKLGTMTGWSSTHRDAQTGFRTTPATAKDSFEIEIPISNTGSPFGTGTGTGIGNKIGFANTKQLPADSRVWIELQVGIENFEGRICNSRSGSGYIPLYDIQQSVMENGSFETDLELAETQFPVQTQSGAEPYKKGTVSVHLMNPEVIKGYKIEESAKKYALTAENEKYITDELSLWVDNSMSITTNMKPIGDNLNKVDFPIWNDTVTLCGDAFALSATNINPDERYWSNLVDAVFKSKNIDSNWFVSVAEEQFKNPGTPVPEFKMICETMSSVVSSYSWSIPYLGDKTYVMGTDSMGRPATSLESIEAFSYGANQNAADCEDSGDTNKQHAQELAHGRPGLKNPSKYWMQKGGWEDARLNAMQRIMHHYVPALVLTTVTSAKIERQEGIRVKIGSKEDMNAQIGAHMYCQLVPEDQFIEMLERTGNKPEIRGFRDQAPKIAGLVTHVCEGTGSVSSLGMPIGEYFNSGPEKARFEKYHENFLSAQRILLGKDSIWETASYEQKQEYTKDIPETRVSEFYRTSAHYFTDVPYQRWGINALKFEAVSRSSPEKEWKYGFDVRDIIVAGKATKTSDDVRRSENIGFIPTGRFTQEQMEIAKNMTLHTPVKRAGRLDPEYVSVIHQMQWKDVGLVGQAFDSKALSSKELVDDFNKRAEKATSGRMKKISDPADTFRFHMFYKNGDFFSGKIKTGEKMESLRTALIKDIEKNDRILGVQVELTPISGRKGDTLTDCVFRVDAYIDVLLKGYNGGEKEKKGKGKGKESIGRSFKSAPVKELIEIRFEDKSTVKISMKNKRHTEFVIGALAGKRAPVSAHAKQLKSYESMLKWKKEQEKIRGKVKTIESEKIKNPSSFKFVTGMHIPIHEQIVEKSLQYENVDAFFPWEKTGNLQGFKKALEKFDPNTGNKSLKMYDMLFEKAYLVSGGSAIEQEFTKKVFGDRKSRTMFFPLVDVANKYKDAQLNTNQILDVLLGFCTRDDKTPPKKDIIIPATSLRARDNEMEIGMKNVEVKSVNNHGSMTSAVMISKFNKPNELLSITYANVKIYFTTRVLGIAF